MLIRNMGLFWDRSKVFWGKGSSRGEIKGIWRKSRRSKPVDFWEQIGIYALYTKSFDLVYVGQAGAGDKSCLGSRIRKHTRDDLAARWDLFSWFGLIQVNSSSSTLSNHSVTRRSGQTPEVLNLLEGVLIAVAEPPLNRQGGRFGENVQRYLQVPDDRLPDSLEAQVKELSMKLDSIEHTVGDWTA